jgi:hypothetical protein
MANRDSVKKIIERSRLLRQRTDAMVADRRMQAFQPSQNGAGRMTGMLDKVRNEVVRDKITLLLATRLVPS